MMIAPFLGNRRRRTLDLPEARASEVDDTDNVEVTFTLNREIWVGEDQLALEEIQPLPGHAFAGAPHAVAVVKADRNLPYGEVEKLIAEVEAAQAPRIALATKEKDRKEPAMIMRHIDRSRATGGGMATSFVAHGGLLLLLALLLGQRGGPDRTGRRADGDRLHRGAVRRGCGGQGQAEGAARGPGPNRPGAASTPTAPSSRPQKAEPESPRPEPAARPGLAEVEVAAPDIAPQDPAADPGPGAATGGPRPRGPRPRRSSTPSRLSGTLKQAEAIEA